MNFMMLFQKTIDENSTIADRLGLGFQTLLLGMLTIFAILFIIYIIIWILGKVMSVSKNKEKSKSKGASDINENTVVAPPSGASESSKDKNNEELVAVIAAAVSAYTGEPSSKFRVVSFKHIK